MSGENGEPTVELVGLRLRPRGPVGVCELGALVWTFLSNGISIIPYKAGPGVLRVNAVTVDHKLVIALLRNVNPKYLDVEIVRWWKE